MRSHSIWRRLGDHWIDGFVLVFHDVSSERFEALIDCVGPLHAIHLGDLVQRARAGKPTAGLFSITVDDGAGETVRGIANVLRARSWPATFFLPTGYLDSEVGMPFQWWRKLEAHLPREVIRLDSRLLDLAQSGARRVLSKRVQALWHTCGQEAYLPLTMELVEYLAIEKRVDRIALLPPAPLSWGEVEELSRDDLIRFESHGVSHTAMSALLERDLAYEMKRSRDIISEHTSRECRHLAYPFGSDQSIGTLAPQLARQYYDSAATMSLGSVRGANPWLLPRIPLYPQNSHAKARLKVLLKCGKWTSRRSDAAAESRVPTLG